jgi:hypothetical protein
VESHDEVDGSATRASRLRSRAAGVVLAVAASVAVWAVASLVGAPLEVSSPLVGTLQISAILVIASALLLALAAWGVLALLEGFARRPRTIWTATAFAVLILSVPPLAFLDASGDTKVALVLMHVVTGLVLILIFRRRARTVRAT